VTADLPKLRPQITTARLLLRPFALSDEAALFAAINASSEALLRWMIWFHDGYQISETRDFIQRGLDQWQRGEEFPLGIFDRQTGALLGGTGINTLDRLNRRANLGYWVRSDVARRGIATEAARALAPAVLEDLPLERLEIVAAVTNVASQRVAEKAGAVRESIARQRVWLRTHAADAVIYSITRADYGLPPTLA